MDNGAFKNKLQAISNAGDYSEKDINDFKFFLCGNLGADAIVNGVKKNFQNYLTDLTIKPRKIISVQQVINTGSGCVTQINISQQ